MNKVSGIVFAAVFACLLMAALSSAESLENRDVYEPRYFPVYREGRPGSGMMDSKIAMREERATIPSSIPASSGSGLARTDVCVGERDPEPLVLCRAETEKDPFEETSPVSIADPLEPLNRAFYHFNDKLYFWLMKPLATGYRAVMPERVRVGVKNIFYNLSFPVRFVNCLLQGKGKGACDEFVRFFTNSTIGMGGFLDVASSKLELKKFEEDLGQTLGSYGAGPAFYINWPILGPSSVRDTIGSVGDAFLDPLSYMISRSKYRIGVRAFSTVNKTSLSIGEYEDLKRAALDPYIAIRDAYFQYRQNKIRE